MILYHIKFNLFTPKQQEEFYNVTDELKIHKALQIEDFSLVTELIEKGQSVPYYAAGDAIKADRLDLLKYFVKHGIISVSYTHLTLPTNREV